MIDGRFRLGWRMGPFVRLSKQSQERFVPAYGRPETPLILILILNLNSNPNLNLILPPQP